MVGASVSKSWFALMAAVSVGVALLVVVAHFDSWRAQERMVQACESMGAHVELRSPGPNPLVVPGSDLYFQCVSATGEPLDPP